MRYPGSCRCGQIAFAFGRPLAGAAVLLQCLLLPCPAAADAVFKCAVDGKVVFQDKPCKEETIAEGAERQQKIAKLHAHLDLLQAKGVGMLPEVHLRYGKADPPPAAEGEDGRYVPVPRGAGDRRTERAAIEAQTRRKNAESVERLSEAMRKAEETCKGPLDPLPKVGMSDEHFRVCTMHARFNFVSQVVATTHEGRTLRLYVYDTQRARRVYSVDGVVTAVRP